MAIERDESNKLLDANRKTPYTCKDLSARIKAYMASTPSDGIPALHTDTGLSPAATRVMRNQLTPGYDAEANTVTVSKNRPPRGEVTADLEGPVGNVGANHADQFPAPRWVVGMDTAWMQPTVRVMVDRNLPHPPHYLPPTEHVEVACKPSPPCQTRLTPPPEGELEGPVTPFGRKPTPYHLLSSNPSFDLHTITTGAAYTVDPRPWEKYLGEIITLELRERVREDLRNLDQANVAEERVTPERRAARERLQIILHITEDDLRRQGRMW